MRILQITPGLFCSTSGLAVAVTEAAAGLHAAGVDVTVASVDDALTGTLPTAVFPCLVAERFRLPGLAQWHYSRRLRPMIEAAFSTPPDVVHAHGLWLYPQWLAERLARQWNRPLVITLHGMLEPWRRRHHGWRKGVMWLVSDHRTVSATAALIATSEQEAEHLREAGVRQPVVVIPPGVRVPEWVGGRSDGESVRRSDGRSVGQLDSRTVRPPDCRTAGLSDSLTVGPSDCQTVGLPDRRTGARRTALFLSRIHPSKGLTLLVDAVAKLRPPGWRFVIAGPDDDGHAEEVRRRAARAGVAEWFEFPGAACGDDKWRLYLSADLFVLPSYNENFGLVIAEALAAGVPVVTTTETPWRELSRRGCGWICEPSGDLLAQALSEAFACSDERLRQMGAIGAAWVQQDFTPEENTRRHVELYGRMVSGE